MVMRICVVCDTEFKAYGCQKSCSSECSRKRIKKYDEARSGKPRGPSIRTAYKRFDDLDPNFWKREQTRELCWFLGLITSDGNVDSYKVRFGLQKADEEVLSLIKTMIGSGAIVNGNYKTKATYAVSCKEWVRDLTKMGVGPAKSLNVVYIDTKYPWDYLRGLWDGDGHIHVSTKTTPVAEYYSSSKPLMDGLTNYLSSQGLIIPKIYVRRTPRAQHDQYKLHLRVNDTIFLIKNMYGHGGPMIKRKYERARDALSVKGISI